MTNTINAWVKRKEIAEYDFLTLLLLSMESYKFYYPVPQIDSMHWSFKLSVTDRTSITEF